MYSALKFPRAGFRRRIGAWIYDALLVLAIFMIAGYAGIGLLVYLDYLTLISLVRTDLEINWNKSADIYRITYHLWNISWISFFFIWFWSKTGQTLGMKAWRLRVQNQDGSLISKTTGLKRLLPTLLGLGNFTVIFDRQNKLSLQDRLTSTEVVVLTLEANRGRL
jgi:uncharacterized RDD family membrane protein YckC